MKLIKSPVIGRPKPRPIEPKREAIQETLMPVSDGYRDMYENCKWCKYFHNGACHNDRAFDLNGEDLEDTIQYAYGESDMNIVLEEEGLSEALLVRLEGYFTKKVFKEDHEEMVEIIQTFLYDEVADIVVQALQGGASNLDSTGVVIKEPTDFKCSEFW